MSSSRKSKRKQTPQEMKSPTAQRPQSLLQRLSSSISSIITSLPPRRPTPKSDIKQRPQTAPNPCLVSIDGKVIGGSQSRPNQREFLPKIKIPVLFDPDRPRSYDPNSYHTFPSIEKSRCHFCSLRPPSRPRSGMVYSRGPCSECQSKSPFWRITRGRKFKYGGSKIRFETQSRVSRSRNTSSLSEEGPRLVPASVTAKRIGNPPRRAELPIPRLPSMRTLQSVHNPHSQQHTRQNPINVGKSVFGPSAEYSGNVKVRTASPKLHHILGLPNAKDYPFVHKREVEKHIAALEAGSGYPLEQRGSRFSSGNTSTVVADYSETVFYGSTITSATQRRSNEPRPAFSSQSRSTTLRIERTETAGRVALESTRRERINTLNVELESSEVYRRRSLQSRNQVEHNQSPNAAPQIAESESTVSSTDILATPTVGGRRLELKGGSQSGVTKLRGGSREKYACNQGRLLRLKTWILTGSFQPYNSETYSDCDVPPARTLDPARVSEASRRGSGSVPLPASLSRGTDINPTTQQLLRLAQQQRSIWGSKEDSQRHLFKAGLLTFRCLPDPDSPINVPTTSKPLLRGGADSSSLLKNDRHPPMLYWLVGSTGRRLITVGSWKKQRPNTRTEGLLESALYGAKAGTKYVKEVI